MSIYYWGKLKLFSIARPRFILIEWIVFVRLRKSGQMVFFVLKK